MTPSLTAQTSSAPIGVSAKVQSAVTLSGMVPLDFGAGIVPGTPAGVTAANGGKIMVSYNVNTQLSLPNTVTLTGGGGGSVVVTLSCAQSATGTAPPPTPFATDCATGYGATLVGNARTDWWLYLGGDTTGAATPSVPPAVDAQGTGTGGAAGAIVLNANQAVAISASFSPLTSAGMPNLAITPSCGWSTTNSTSIANTTLFACSGGAYTSPAMGTGAGGVYVWLGGSVATTTATPAGDYAGTATITGVYTSY